MLTLDEGMGVMARRRASDHDDKREAILHRAADVFAREGYDRASMAQLAAECGVSKALLYHYYASKEALLFAIVQNHLSQLVAVLEEADDPGIEPRLRLEALVLALLEAYRGADSEHQVQLGAMRYLPEQRQNDLKALERRLVAIVSDALVAAEPRLADERGLLKPVTMSLFGMLNWVYLWFRPEGPLTREAYGRLATALILSGVSGAV